MELQGERLIPASVERTWEALNDPDFLKSCIANCESLERTDADTLAAVVAMKVGPVNARFKGKLTITNVQAPTSYTILFEGQGGVAGFGKGSADVSLSPAAEGQTTLGYLAKATVGGKIAQIGSRLIDSAAGKITNDFFTAFETQMEARNTAMAGGASTGFGTAPGAGGLGDGAGPGIDLGGASVDAAGSGRPVTTPGTPGTPNLRVAEPAPIVSLAGPIARTEARVGPTAIDPAVAKTWVLIGALVAVGAIYFSIR